MPGWQQRFLEYLLIALLVLSAGNLTKRLGQADILGDQGLGKSVTGLLPVADILYYVGSSVESYFPLAVAFMLAFAAAKRPNAAMGLAVLASWTGYAGSITALSSYTSFVSTYSAGINLGLFGGVIVGFWTALAWSIFRFRRVTRWARMVSGIPLVIALGATGGVVLGILVGVAYQLMHLVVVLGLGGALANLPVPLSAALYAFLHPLAEVTGWGTLLDLYPFTEYGICQTPAGDTLKGSYTCFIYAGSQVEGQQALYLAGGYPVVGFGLTALFFILWVQLRGQHRQYWRILYWMLMASTFLAGSDRPALYLFVFAAPLLLVFHMFASAFAAALTALLGVTIGWAGGPGLIDLLRWAGSGSGLLLLLILGVIFATIYVVVGFMVPSRLRAWVRLGGYGVPFISKPLMAIPSESGKRSRSTSENNEETEYLEDDSAEHLSAEKRATSTASGKSTVSSQPGESTSKGATSAPRKTGRATTIPPAPPPDADSRFPAAPLFEDKPTTVKPLVKFSAPGVPSPPGSPSNLATPTNSESEKPEDTVLSQPGYANPAGYSAGYPEVAPVSSPQGYESAAGYSNSAYPPNQYPNLPYPGVAQYPYPPGGYPSAYQPGLGAAAFNYRNSPKINNVAGYPQVNSNYPPGYPQLPTDYPEAGFPQPPQPPQPGYADAGFDPASYGEAPYPSDYETGESENTTSHTGIENLEQGEK